MPRAFHPQPLTTLDRLDSQLRELSRQQAQILDLDAFRRQLERASGQPTALQRARLAETHTTDTENQLRHELNLAFADLGGAAFALIHHGALNDKQLAPHVQRVHQIYAQLDALAHSTPVDPADHKTAN
ncbi:MAG: hypothetical protein ACXVHK_29415 [Solirubrobacteraceae bacterium]